MLALETQWWYCEEVQAAWGEAHLERNRGPLTQSLSECPAKSQDQLAPWGSELCQNGVLPHVSLPVHIACAETNLVLPKLYRLEQNKWLLLLYKPRSSNRKLWNIFKWRWYVWIIIPYSEDRMNSLLLFFALEIFFMSSFLIPKFLREVANSWL